MLGFLERARKQRLTFEQLQILQFLTQQVVLSVQGSVDLPGLRKKAIALELTGQLLDEIGMVAPESLVDTMIESAVTILKSLDKALEREIRPKYTLDLSGRPKTGG